MPSKRKQLNLRADDETLALFARLMERAQAMAPPGTVATQTAVLRAALAALEREYDRAETKTAPRTRKHREHP
jgi:hypothetical protein